MKVNSFSSCTQISLDFADSFLNLRNQGNLRTIFYVVFCLYLIIGVHSVAAQTSTPQLTVTITVLDAKGQPVAEKRVELVIFQYAMSVEPLSAGGCETDELGSCLISTNIPPSSGPDSYEGVVYVAYLGRQLVGWQGNETLIVIQLTPEGFVPTDEPHLHGPYTGEQYAPTEGSPDLSPTVPPAQPTETPMPSETLAAPFTPSLPPTPTSSPPPAPNTYFSPFIIACLIISLFVIVGVLWGLHTYRIRRHG